MKPTLAIIGGPNVGKSTLFNRIVGIRKALTSETPGATRDRNFALADWKGREFLCVDTGGFPTENGSLEDKINSQIEIAIDESDVIVCLFDGQAGPIPEEENIVEKLRKVNKSIYYVVNKIDVPQHEGLLNDFYRLGITKLYPVSAEHGFNVAELLDQIVEDFPEDWDALSDQSPSHINEIRIAIVGRPNVGKSSLVNCLLGQSRIIVDEVPGTTRDSIDTSIHYEGRSLMLIDTAGMRRRSQKGNYLEKLSLLQASRAIDRAHLCLLVLSVEDGLLKQDAHIAGYVMEQYKGLLIVWNKMDLAQWDDRNRLDQWVRKDLSFVSKSPIHYISAKNKVGIDKIFPETMDLYDELGRTIPTAKINKVLSGLTIHHPIPLYKGREVKLFYVTQVATHPPEFIIFCNFPQGIPNSYRRYLINGIKEHLGLERIPIQIIFRKRK